MRVLGRIEKIRCVWCGGLGCRQYTTTKTIVHSRVTACPHCDTIGYLYLMQGSKPQLCPRCQGMPRGMDNCNVCDNTGSVIYVDRGHYYFPNTKEGFIEACEQHLRDNRYE